MVFTVSEGGNPYISGTTALDGRVKMVLTQAGRLGIGITSPSQLLHLQTTLEASSGVGTAIQITSDGAGGDQAWIGVNKGTSNGLELSVENRDIIFNTGATTPFGGTERMRITSGGRVGIGTTDPGTALDVNGIASFGTTTKTEIGNAGENPVSAGVNYGIFHQSGIGLGIASGAGGSTQGIAFWSNNGTSFFRSMTITGGSGNVGIGTITPSVRLQIDAASATASATLLRLNGGNTGFLGTNDANTGYSINFDGCAFSTAAGVVQRTGAQIEMLKNGSWNQEDTGGGTPGHLVFKTNSGTIASPNLAERMRITSDGYVRLTSSSGGIQFNGDTAAANALDDYEEGTWTPTFINANFSGTFTATYTKIGRKVTVQLSFVNQSISSVTGTAQIGGLPFTSTNVYQAGSITYADILTTAGSVYVQNNNTNLYFLQNTGTTPADWNAGTNSRSLMLTATYFV
jgi:hypothetical protein